MPSNAKRSILVVEDDRITARALRRCLERMGYEVLDIASSADQAVELAFDHKPDLILMDIKLNGAADGIDAAIRIQARSTSPIVFLTASAAANTLERTKKVTPYGYLLKPARYDELRMVIALALHKHGQETGLRERERWFSTTIHSIADAVITVDPLGKITFMNLAAARMTGVPSSDGVGRHVTQVLQLTDPAHEEAGSLHTSTVERLLECTLRDGRVVELVETRLRNRMNGDELEIADSAAPVMSDGHLLGAVMVLRDITERKKLQATLLVSDRMASIGLLAAGVAHEINNPLAVVMATVDAAFHQVVKTTTDPGADRPGRMFEMLEDIRTASTRIRDIVRDVGTFSRTEDPELSNVDPRQVMKTTLRMADHALRLHARIETHYGAVPFVAASESRLAQVFLNLLVNASQAIPEGQRERHCIRISMMTDENGAAAIAIADTGAGMSEATLKRLFTPFFTTKNVGAGTGLGLSICRRIVASFDGTIQIESEVGRGTTVHIMLPAASALPLAPLGPVGFALVG